MLRKRPQVLGVNLNRSELRRLLISQTFLPRSVTNGRSRDALRPNAFSGRVAPPATLALADDAALARLVIAAAQRRSPLPASKLSESRGRCPCGLEWSPDAWYP